MKEFTLKNKTCACIMIFSSLIFSITLNISMVNGCYMYICTKFRAEYNLQNVIFEVISQRRASSGEESLPSGCQQLLLFTHVANKPMTAFNG